MTNTITKTRNPTLKLKLKDPDVIIKTKEETKEFIKKFLSLNGDERSIIVQSYNVALNDKDDPNHEYALDLLAKSKQANSWCETLNHEEREHMLKEEHTEFIVHNYANKMNYRVIVGLNNKNEALNEELSMVKEERDEALDFIKSHNEQVSKNLEAHNERRQNILKSSIAAIKENKTIASEKYRHLIYKHSK